LIRRASDGIVSYQFENFNPGQVSHALYTRLGGVSEGPYTSLNLGGTCGDVPGHVKENHLRLFKNFGRPFESRFDVWQVHGDTIHFTDHPRPETQKHQPGDAIFTRNPEVTLVMRFADCVPILFHDPVQKAVGIVHAGWQGTLIEVAAMAVRALADHYGSNPKDLIVGIGPSICGNCYQVGEDLRKKFLARWGEKALDFINMKDDGYYLDLWAANEWILRSAGVMKVEQANICTAENLDEWYSYRKEKGLTGRFAVAIALNAGA
jgi:YfiH family protein